MTVIGRLAQLVDQVRVERDRPPVDPPLQPDDFLPEVLDSMALASLIALIEEEWSFQFDDELIEPAIFESLRSLAAFVSNAAGVQP